MQKGDIQNDREFRELWEEFASRLRELDNKSLLRHGLAAMALAMQESMTGYDTRGKVMHADDLELIMRGMYSALCGDGRKSHHAVEKMTLGYFGLMFRYHPNPLDSLVAAADAFRAALRKS